MKRENKTTKPFPRYLIFTENELLSLIVCIMLDISEYIVAILLMTAVGDILDLVGIIACLAMFRWVGLLSLFELVPGADILPIFIITWLIWYSRKKQSEKEEQERLQKKWT